MNFLTAGRVRHVLRALAAGVCICVVPELARPAEDPIEIHAILPLTGYGAFLGKAGVDTTHAVENFVNKSGGIKGRPIKFIVQDDQSSPQVAVQLANALFAQKVAVIFGPELSANCNAIMPLLNNGPVTYCMSSGIRAPAGSYMFAAGQSSLDQIGVAINYAHRKGWDKMAVLTSTDATGQDADRVIDAAMSAPENKGLTVVAREHFATNDISVSAQLARIRAAGGQVILAWTTGTPMGTVLRGIQEAGLDVPVIGGSANVTFTQMQQYASIMPKQLLFSSVPGLVPDALPAGSLKNAALAFQSAFKTIGVRPDNAMAVPWDPALLIVEAYRKFGASMTAEELRGYIADAKWVGVAGTFDFRASPQHGVGRSDIVVLRWDPSVDNWVAVSRPGGGPLP